MDAKELGAKIIVADPRYTPTAWTADIFLQHKPGTDIALINGMINTIIEENLYDKNFVEERTVGFDQIKATAAKYDARTVEKITGVSSSLLQEAARLYAKARPAAIVYCMGITQHTCGHGNVVSCANLALICGNIGRQGTGVLPLRGQDNVQGACDMGCLPTVLPGYASITDEALRRRMAKLWGREDLPAKPGLTVVEMTNAAAEGKIKAMYIMGENPVVSDPNTKHVREALNKLDFLLVQDIFLTETAELADVVLPGACWAEKEGTVTATSRSVQWRAKAIAPPGEARADLDIICDIANKLSLKFDYQNADDVLREINIAVPSYGGITPERVKKQMGGFAWPCPTPEHPGTPILYSDTFATAERLGKLIPVEYQPPFEATDDEYPLLLTTGRVVMHYNAGAMTRRSASLLKRSPELFVEVNPADAERLCISDGEEVKVSTRRGDTTARTVITRRIPQGVVFMPFHFQGTNELVVEALDQTAKIPELKIAACKITKNT